MQLTDIQVSGFHTARHTEHVTTLREHRVQRHDFETYRTLWGRRLSVVDELQTSTNHRVEQLEERLVGTVELGESGTVDTNRLDIFCTHEMDALAEIVFVREGQKFEC